MIGYFRDGEVGKMFLTRVDGHKNNLGGCSCSSRVNNGNMEVWTAVVRSFGFLYQDPRRCRGCLLPVVGGMGGVRGQSICEICPAFLWCLFSGRGRGATSRLEAC